MECGLPSEELRSYRRVCDACHKRLNEARARPFIITSARRRKDVEDDLRSYFDTDLVDRAARARAHDLKCLRERQQKLVLRREESDLKKFDTPDLPQVTSGVVDDYRSKLRAIFEKHYLIGGRVDKRQLQEVAYQVACAVIPHSARHTLKSTAPILDLLLARTEGGLLLEDAQKLIGFIAGNYTTLREGLVPRAWVGCEEELGEWALLRVDAVSDGYEDPQGRPGFYMRTDIMSGALAGRVLTAGYAQGVETRVAKKFGVQKKDLELAVPKILVGTVGFGYLCLGFHGHPRARSFAATDTQRRTNRVLVKSRITPESCRYRLKPQLLRSCAECPLGRKPARPFGPFCSQALLEQTLEIHLSDDVKQAIRVEEERQEREWKKRLSST